MPDTRMETSCVIDDIIAKKLEAYVIFEDEAFIGFLDHHPLFLGHTLLSPKGHFETLYELPDNLLSPFFALAQQVGKAVQQAMNAEGTFMAMNNIVSQSISHLHLHIIPRNHGDGLKGFFWPRMRYESEAHAMLIRDKIRQDLLHGNPR